MSLDLRPRCRYCDDTARHRLGTGDEWAEVCCACADQLMAALALTVPADEGVDGFARWCRDHRQECPEWRPIR